MAKKIKTIVKLQVEGGRATPAPPVGTALGPHGINLQQFVSQFNDATKDKQGEVTPCEITIYEDRSFDFEIKLAPVADMIKKKLGIQKGSGVPNRDIAGTLSVSQAEEIAKEKMRDLNTDNVEAALKIVIGTARSMGVKING